MSTDRTNIEEAKRNLPLPALLERLGFTPPGGTEGGNMQSPFSKGRKQKTPSFSIFRIGDSWGWKDRTGGQDIGGDEITLLEKIEGLSSADAIRRYVALAGVESARPAVPARKAALPDEAFDWPAAVESFGPEHSARLCAWRGYSPEFVAWLKSQSLVGAVRDGIALPVRNGAGEFLSAHIRPKSGKWFYTPKRKGVHPLTVGPISTAAKVMVFESQWDAFAIMDAARWHESPPEGWAVLVTRGASNGKFAGKASGAIYAWPQNDEEKDGKKAGEVWLSDVLVAASGPVYRVPTPPEFADANDWTRARPVDAWAAIEAASLEAPADNAGKVGKAVKEEPPARPPFDPGKVLDDLGLYWLNITSSYFVRGKDDNGRLRFVGMGADSVKRKLRVRGLRSRPDPDSGESVSQIDRVLDEATESRVADYALCIGGTPAGVYDLPGGRVIVRESPRLLEPVAGDFPTIDAFLTALLGADTLRFCCWLKVAYEALRAGARRPGQALIIVGPPDCGKSRIQHQIITPILAGRSADPKSFFFGRTDFNAELVGAEHLLIEEVPSSSKHDERLFFGERIKEIVANDTARLHDKQRTAVTVSPFWRLSITLNDNPEKLRCLPPLSDDLAEKIIMLQAKQAPEFWQRFANEPDPRKAFRDAIDRELPAFAHWLLGLAVPPDLQGRRYGVQSYIPEELGLTIFEGEQEHHLLLLIDKGLFAEEDAPTPWRGDAEDLKQALCAELSPVRGSASRLMGNIQLSTVGIWLSHLASKFPSRVVKHRTADKRDWIIHPREG